MDYKKISSPDNEKIKILKKLGQKKYRKEYGKFVVENYAIIHDALNSGFYFEELFITKNFTEKQVEKTAFLFNNSKIKSCYLIDDRVNKSFSELDNPSGVACVYPQKQCKANASAPAVYMNGISDPGNMGTIMRTALAFGFKNIIIDNTCADVYNSKTISASKDAIFKLNIIEDVDGDWLVKNHDEYCIIAANSNEGKPLKDVPLNKKVCLVLGNESHGISESLADLVHENIKIEISPDIESLNVASAAAILLNYFSNNIRKRF